jgi:hypothetical protein
VGGQLHAAAQAFTLAADLAEASDRVRRKLVQARQAALWLSGQVDATGAELDRARDETRRMAAMCDQLSLRKCARGGDVCATGVKTNDE